MESTSELSFRDLCLVVKALNRFGANSSQYQNIPLHSDAEFDELASNAGLIVPDEPHERMVARLNYELSERKRYAAPSVEYVILTSRLIDWTRRRRS